MLMESVKPIASKPDDFRAGGVVYRKAIVTHNEAIRSVLNKTLMPSWVSLSTEFEPDYFASQTLFGDKQTILATKVDDPSVTVGMCAYTRMRVHVDGKETEVGYLGELRILPEYRHRINILRNGFRSVHYYSQQQAEISHWYTSIAKDNHVAHRLLESGIKSMPKYQRLQEMVSLAIPAKRHNVKIGCQQAQETDVPELVKFYNRQAKQYQYSPVLTEAWIRSLNGKNGLRIEDFYLLKKGEAICGCFALWDQRAIKQTVVRGYQFPLNLLRNTYNVYARIFGRVVLPRPGNRINYIFIAFAAIDENYHSEFSRMISEAISLIKERGADIAMLGLADNNPLLKKLDCFPKQVYRTYIEKVTFQNQPDLTELSDPSNSRIVQPEIAVL